MFILHDIEGFKHNEIAQMLGCSVGNSKSQVYKARMKLRQLLQQTFGGSAPQHHKPIPGSLTPEPLNHVLGYANA
jgi:RNA polymerase sigma-70 factor (ECF subfamily)